MLIRRSLSPVTSRIPQRMMSKVSIPHSERTAGEPRDDNLHRVTVDKITEVNDDIRLFRLIPVDQNSGLKFLPGQWLDVYTPKTPKAGGFTITSPPNHLHPSSPNPTPHLELAIQKSPHNPPAAYLWQPTSQILNTNLQIRVGGSFIFPPSPARKFTRVIFIAGGVGVNPLMSMLSQILIDREGGVGSEFEIRFLYTVRETPSHVRILFLERIYEIIKRLGDCAHFTLFLTSSSTVGVSTGTARFPDGRDLRRRRIMYSDLMEMLGPVEQRGEVLCYICGVPGMTDEFVEVVGKAEGMNERNVFFEKWW